MILSNPPAERAVLSACLKSSENYFEVADLIKDSTFLIDSNKIIFKIIDQIYKKDANSKIDLPLLLSTAQELNLQYFFEKKTELQHLEAISAFPVKQENIRKFAIQIKKLEIARNLNNELEKAQDKLLEVTGSESIAHILGIAEAAILDFGSGLNNSDETPSLISKTIDDYIINLENNKVDSVGIPTGLLAFDEAIGTLRKSSITLIGARPKTGKSTLASYFASYIGQLGVPVLKLDAEMSVFDDTARLISSMSDVPIKEIETGTFKDNPGYRFKVYQIRDKLKKLPYYFKSVAGKPIEEILSIARRWLLKDVGLYSDGTAKDCVIIYDYIKSFSEKDFSNIQEYQALGFAINDLSALAVKYNIPIILFSQLNRENEISASDRLTWTASSINVLRRKSDEEIAMEGPEKGTHKLETKLARHGPGMNDREFVNLLQKNNCTKFVYLGTKAEIAAREKQNSFEIEENE